MRLCTSTNIMNFDQGKNYAVSMETSARVCARAGYRFLDANLCAQCRPDMPLSTDGWEAWSHSMRALAEELNIRFTQAHAYWPIHYTVHADGTRSDGDWGEELMRRSVIAAEILGVEWMVVHPMRVYEGSRYSPRHSLAYNYGYFSKWAAFYAEHHVGMAIENMNSTSGKPSYAAEPEELLALIERIGHPMVGACLDTGHAHLTGIDVAGAVRLLGKHLRATHIADNHQNKDEHFAPYNGTIDWPGVMRALKEIGYAHDFAFEIHNLTSCYPAAVQEHLVRFSYQLGEHLMGLA